MRANGSAAVLRHVRRNRHFPLDRDETATDADEHVTRVTPPSSSPDPADERDDEVPDRVHIKPTDDAAAEIDTLVNCLTSTGRCCLRDRRDSASILQFARLWLGFLIVLCLGSFFIHAHVKKRYRGAEIRPAARGMFVQWWI